MNLSNMTRKCGIILRDRQLSCTGISRNLWRVDCRSDDLKFPFLLSFCVLIHIFLDCESCSFLLGSQHPLSKIALFPVEIAIYYARFSGRFVFFLSIICQRTGLMLNEKKNVINFPLVRTLKVFT